MLRKLASTALACLLVACGGGGDGDDDSNSGGPTGPQSLQGFFIDDAVQALTYETGGNLPQLTDENGVFAFQQSQPITFSVDGIVIGTVNKGLSRITPSDFGSSSVNIMRFLQSLDQTPLAPGIDLRGVNLPDVQLNFGLGNSSFAADADVIAAVAAAGPSGGGAGTGVLIDQNTALANFGVGTSMVLPDLRNLAFYPVSAGVNEPCFALLSGNELAPPGSGRYTGQNICQDDIDANPDNGPVEFVWYLDGGLATLDFDFGAGVEERVSVQQLGKTGDGITSDRIHAYVVSECLPCDPFVEPEFEFEVQTLYKALPLPNLNNQTLDLVATSDGTATLAQFGAGTAGTLDTGGTIEPFLWAPDPGFDMLVLRGTGAGSTLLYHRLILIDGTINNGRLAALLARVEDTNDNDVADAAELGTATYLGVELFRSN